MTKKSIKQSEYLIRNALRKARHERKRKLIRKKLRYESLKRRTKKTKVKKFINRPRKSVHEECIATETFSLLIEPVNVITYFNKAKNSLTHGTPVIFDWREVSTTGPETIMYLCAFITDESFTKRTAYQGYSPKTAKLKEMFIKTGFFEHVNSQYNAFNPQQEYFDKLIHRISSEQVEPELTGKVVASAVRHTFGKDVAKLQKSYTILIECMSNSWNHASPEKEIKIYNWWLLAYKEPDTLITKFCFLDLGIGIFDSLGLKYKENKLSSLLKALIIPSDNCATLTKIFSGENRTSTNKDERGNGLISIYNWVKTDNHIENFTIISNDVIAEIGYNKPDTVKPIGSMFTGTMYYWELIP